MKTNELKDTYDFIKEKTDYLMINNSELKKFLELYQANANAKKDKDEVTYTAGVLNAYMG